MKIFIIDDDESTTTLLSKFLSYKGYEIVVTNDPMVALKRIRRECFDVILLDINMPGISGFNIIGLLAGSDILKDQNIFIFSGITIPEIQLKNLLRRDGINGFLKKPIDLDDLANAIAS